MSDVNKSVRATPRGPAPDLICVSNSRWTSLDEGQRRLLSRQAAEGRRVFFVEAPSFHGGAFACVDLVSREGVQIAVPHLPGHLPGGTRRDDVLRGLVDEVLATTGNREYELWYDASPPAAWIYDLNPLAVAPMMRGDLPAEKSAKAAGIGAGERALRR